MFLFGFGFLLYSEYQIEDTRKESRSGLPMMYCEITILPSCFTLMTAKYSEDGDEWVELGFCR